MEISRENLSEEERSDLDAATSARKQADSSKSGFAVGAAIRTGDGEVFVGWNLEDKVQNGIHAEANALGRIPKESRASGIVRVVVVGALEGEESDEPTAPCGICSQRLIDRLSKGENPEVIMAGTHGSVVKVLLRDLLPYAFKY